CRDCTFTCCVFQAEAGIRDRNVTGVQTCALPILGLLRRAGGVAGAVPSGQGGGLGRSVGAGVVGVLPVGLGILAVERVGRIVVEIGRASCRERGWNREEAGAVDDRMGHGA